MGRVVTTRYVPTTGRVTATWHSIHQEDRSGGGDLRERVSIRGLFWGIEKKTEWRSQRTWITTGWLQLSQVVLRRVVERDTSEPGETHECVHQRGHTVRVSSCRSKGFLVPSSTFWGILDRKSQGLVVRWPVRSVSSVESIFALPWPEMESYLPHRLLNLETSRWVFPPVYNPLWQFSDRIENMYV